MEFACCISCPAARQSWRRSKRSRASAIRPVQLAPVEQRRQRGEERLAGVGELVLDARRHARVDVAQHEAVALELAQRGREHAARDAVDLAQQLVEALGAVGQAGEDGEAPLRTEHAERALEGVEAWLVGKPGGASTCRCGTRLHSVPECATFAAKWERCVSALTTAQSLRVPGIEPRSRSGWQDSAMTERPVLVAPDSFKGTFRAAEVAGAIGRGLERAGLMPPDLCPLADGGEGTMEALLLALGGETVGDGGAGSARPPGAGAVRARRGRRDRGARDGLGVGPRARGGGRARRLGGVDLRQRAS